MNAHVPSGPDELTPEWLSRALGAEVTSVSWERVGSGQIGACYRLTLKGEEKVPARLVAKMASEDPTTRAFLASAYRTEVLFYRDVVPTVAVRTPRCHYQAIADDNSAFVLLLEDMAPAEQGDQLAGCTPQQAAAAVTNLAGLHGPRWCDKTLTEIPWLSVVTEDDAAVLTEVFAPAVDAFVQRFTGRLSDEDIDTLRRVADRIAAWAVARPERFGLVHGDYRLDNLLFAPPPQQTVTAVDWQTLSIGHPVRDLSFFLGTAMDPAERSAHERALVETYHTALTGYGVDDYDLQSCWEDYRFGALQGPLITVLGCAVGTPTERGDRMFLAMTRRSCAAIRELGSLELI
ncbi:MULTISPECIES: phosphotransferase family protein [Thermomonospora]|uniref:CHK kinase-like domain-containing protein n=1 Tax=Thermomonospora curvata (strain ATCC 19995 / DSM 43183 / JCM 3096 / KCTC 9072 / NBRC 15933 / NCIMB 10081 / Henssen B9) TaxID=471852 RepID=D1A4X4_THECD|nr:MULTISPECIES: phosphotransferase [Thermomonospora]ACY98143.1 protein of unknown function DUF227 [Thermomonospora curvata DSM 43183]PKK13913.1 MAG: hypothetical protein BUE48_012600 [Thermomonospora sp. CIF 1]